MFGQLGPIIGSSLDFHHLSVFLPPSGQAILLEQAQHRGKVRKSEKRIHQNASPNAKTTIKRIKLELVAI
jgi:hypothetical protein